ncbi:unnamed protein product [Calypogeia fissa]
MMSNQVLSRLCFAVVVVLVTSATTVVLVEGLPILGMDLSTCQPVTRITGDPLECCFVDTNEPIKDFQFNLDLPVRIRRPAHKLDEDLVRKYERAVSLMRALPSEDPRSFEAQARLHCSYTGAYNQFSVSQKFNTHRGWFFFPFHRWFLYFHERILASLIGDDTFAIPYWAWDVQNENNPAANTIPFYYTDRNASLYHEKRSKIHQPPARVDLGQSSGVRPTTNKDPEMLLQGNYYNMWRDMIGQVPTPETFYGEKWSLGTDPDAVAFANFVTGLHRSVHQWTGDDPFGEDMGFPYSSGWDPIFYAHHVQIDRLWLMWKSWGGQDFDDPDWLDTEFLFFDENADLVRVNVRDSLDIENFRVRYEQVYPDWLDFTPKSIRDIDPTYAQASTLKRLWRQLVDGVYTYSSIALALGSFFQQDTNGTNIYIGGGRRGAMTRRSVARPEVLRSNYDDSSFYDEVLVIHGVVEKPYDVSVLMKIFLELPGADENTPQHCVEFLGSVEVDAEGLRVGMDKTVVRKFAKVIGIRKALQILDVTRQKFVTLTFVPAWDPKHDADVSVRVTDLKVEMRPTR